MEHDLAPSLPLARYRLFGSHDLDEARESVARIFCPHRLETVRPRSVLDACHHSALLHRDVCLNYVQYGPSVRIDPGLLGDFFLLQIPLRGGADVHCGAQTVEATPRLASLASPTEMLSMRWDDSSPHLIVKFSRAAMQQHLEGLLQASLRQPLVFDLGVPLDAPSLVPMLQFIDYLRVALDAGDTLQRNSLLASQAEGYLMSTLLLTARHNHSLDERPACSVLPRTVRRAKEMMSSCVDQPLTLADICQQVGVSARSSNIWAPARCSSCVTCGSSAFAPN